MNNFKHLLKLVGLGILVLPFLPLFPLTELFLKYETREGDVKWLNDFSPEKKYEIEEIQVGENISEIGREEYIKSYEGSVDWVNQVAKGQREDLKALAELEKQSKTYRELESNANGLINEVHVNVSFLKKEKE